MNRKILSAIIFLVACFFVMPECSYASFSSVTAPEYPDILFKSKNGNDLKLDIFIPRLGSGVTPYPVVINVPGAFAGTKISTAMDHIVNKGFAYVSIEYVVPNAGTSIEKNMPAQVYDVKDAIRWVKAHASEYNLDSDNMGIIGWSAGGYIAMLAATTNGNPYFDGDYGGITGVESNYDSDVKAVVSLAGISNYLSFAQYVSLSENDQLDVIGCLYSNCSNTYTFLSPISYVSSSTPPTMFIHAFDEDIVLYSQSLNMYNKLIENNVPTEIVPLYTTIDNGTTYSSGKHMFPVLNWASTDNYNLANDKTEYFFKKHLMQIVPPSNSQVDYTDLSDTDINGFLKTGSSYTISSPSITLPNNTNTIKLKSTQGLDFSGVAATASVEVSILNAYQNLSGNTPVSFYKLTINKGAGSSESYVNLTTDENLTVQIENNTSLYSSNSWNKKINPPVDATNTIDRSNFDTKYAINVGGNDTIILDKPAKITLPTKSGDPYFKTSGQDWEEIDKCENANSSSAGSLAFPGTCFLESEGQTIIWTYHFTTFANLEPDELKIEDINYSSTENTITLQWETTNKADSHIRYGIDKNLTKEEDEDKEEKKHKLTLKNLTPNTLYYFRIKATDEYDQEETSKIYKIKTKTASTSLAYYDSTYQQYQNLTYGLSSLKSKETGNLLNSNDQTKNSNNLVPENMKDEIKNTKEQIKNNSQDTNQKTNTSYWKYIIISTLVVAGLGVAGKYLVGYVLIK